MHQFNLLKQLIDVHSPTGEEKKMKDFLLEYVHSQAPKWATKPIILNEGLQDAFILLFGKPRTAVYVHMDTVGFTSRYENQLLSIGSPSVTGGERLVGEDRLGPISCSLELKNSGHMHHDFQMPVERGTSLVYESIFEESDAIIKSAYLDNRVGLYVALMLAETMENGALVFSCGEEHGGGSAGFLARTLFDQYGVKQSLICDVTWVTSGVEAGKGVAVSLRDSLIPRRSYVERILQYARESNTPFQIEVEGSGGSDGSEIHVQPYPIDWCFVGAPILNPHSSSEIVDKRDILSMLSLYDYLLQEL